jgi:methylmalonyl-CoA/ethylmalonyl-CoA epimerase
MPERELDHVGIAVPSLDEAIPLWEAVLDATAAGRETVVSQGVEVIFVGTGTGRVELLASSTPDSTIARFIERRGPGLHHLCYRVADIRAAIAEFAAAGHQPIDRVPRPGAGGHQVAFLHPRTTSGVLIELVESAG